MTAQEAESVKVGDRVQLGVRTGIVEFVVSDVFLVKWDGRRDSDAYTREAFEKTFIPYNPKGEAMTAATLIPRSPFAQPR
jgi:hypothetical protein